MPNNHTTGTARILRRIRAALADLDRNTSVSAVDRLDALYEIQDQIVRRILEMEPATQEADGQPMRWSPVRY